MASRKQGGVVEIKLSNGKYSYARILPHASFAFYNIYSDKPFTSLEEIKQRDILFIIAAYDDAVTKNRWKTLGVLELEEHLKKLPLAFVQDPINPKRFSLYDPNTGEMKPATREQCLGLERAAVWEPEHIEDRIMDHFEDRPCKWVEALKIR